MRLTHFIVTEAFIIPKEMITKSTGNSDLVNLCNEETRLRFVPGTAGVSVESKNSTAGPFYVKDFSCNIAGNLSAEFREKLLNTGALVLRSDIQGYIFLHKNDIINNTYLKPEINAVGLKTQIKFSMNSLFFP